ncbi:GAF domain-containing protein [Azospirillum doebereinerae]
MIPNTSGDSTLAKLRHHQHIVRDFSRLLASYIPLEQLLGLVAHRLSRGLGVGHSMIPRYGSAKGDLWLTAGAGWPAGAVGTARFAIDAASPAGRTQQTRLPACIRDLEANDDFHIPALLRAQGIRSLVNVPVMSGGALWGVLEMESTEPNRFDADDEYFLLSMANMLGVAIERADDATAATDATAKAKADATTAQEAQTLRLHELQHRMENNLAIIASMLLLEQREHSDDRIKERLRGLMDRVAAIGLAHEQLDAQPTGAMVGLARYIAQLAHAAALQHVGIHFDTDLEPTQLPLDLAVPLGLIVNELITNAIKYAFPNQTGTIRISLHTNPDISEATLTVADDGIGMAQPRPGSLGTRLIQGLTTQIRGTMLRPAQERGTVVQVLFPVPLR